LVSTGRGITGTLTRPSELYKLEPLGGDLEAIIRVNIRGFPPEHPR
jgi:hypothetical protein